MNATKEDLQRLFGAQAWTKISKADYNNPPASLLGPFDLNGIYETPCWVFIPGHGVKADTFRLFEPLEWDLQKHPNGYFSGWGNNPTHFIAWPKPDPPEEA